MTQRFVLRDRGVAVRHVRQRRAVTEHVLTPATQIRMGRGGGAELMFLLADDARRDRRGDGLAAVGDLRQMAALLEGLRALGSGRVLDEVLALVLDSAIEVTGAERGFIMLAADEGGRSSSSWRARAAR